jgi:branched-chain amino acid transport system ATP-binding protein
MPESVLAVSGVHTGYGTTEILRGVDLTVGQGEIVAVLGSNGAGKSTLNRTISGVMRAWRGAIRFDGAAIERERPAAIVARGLIHVPEGRRIFPNMTVRENLDLGAYRRARARRAANRSRVFAIFPRLAERQGQRAGTLSGGEQQMLAIGRALMGNPTLLLMDEPLEGLAPVIVDTVLAGLARLKREDHLALLLVEQHARLALEFAENAIVLDRGAIVFSGPACDLLDAPDRLDALMGVGARAR